MSGEKATVTSEVGTEGTDVESLSSPEESRAKAHVWARRLRDGPCSCSYLIEAAVSVLSPATPSGLALQNVFMPHRSICLRGLAYIHLLTDSFQSPL